jgi:hypothetical protein
VIGGTINDTIKINMQQNEKKRINAWCDKALQHEVGAGTGDRFWGSGRMSGLAG